jgi:hypothetical protein
MAVLIDGVKIFSPSSIEPTPIIVAREGQTASGKEVVDIIREKNSVTFDWDFIRYDDLKQILDILSTGVFHQLTYPDPQGGESHTITAKLNGEPRITSWRVVGGKRIWKNVSMSFLER